LDVDQEVPAVIFFGSLLTNLPTSNSAHFLQLLNYRERDINDTLSRLVVEFLNIFPLVPLFELPLRQRSLSYYSRPHIPSYTRSEGLRRISRETALILFSCDKHHAIGAPVDNICDLASIACCFRTTWPHGSVCRCKRSRSKPTGYEVLIFFKAKVDAILRGDMDPSECCSYGSCKGDVVVSVGE
jgi:hypothetical protein